MYRKICLLIAITILAVTISGCYDLREIDDLAYVVAIGLDKGENNYLKMTLQFVVPVALGGGEKSGDSDKSSTITTIETPTIYAGLNIVNSYLSKEINLSHAKVLVISKKLAADGLEKYIHAIIRGREFRPNMHVVIARESAEGYIKSVKPLLEVNPAKYYEMVHKGYKYTGFITPSTLTNFYMQEESSSTQAVATLVGVSKYESAKDFNNQASTSESKGREIPLEGDFKGGDITKIGESKSENMGLAVFDGAKMVGELDGEETLFYLMLTGKYEHSYVSFPDPIKKGDFILLDVKQSRIPIRKVKLEGEKPDIYTKIILEANILSIQSGINYESEENVQILQNSAEKFISEGMKRFLDRTTLEFNSDICGFGNALRWKFLTWGKWEDFRWLEKYKDSAFNIDVDLKIRRPGLMLKSIPAYSSKGKEME